MSSEDKVYRELQEHLDKQAVGFPATESGVEIRILKELFNPEQASLALPLERLAPGRHFIEQSAQGEDVRPGVRLPAFKLLRGGRTRTEQASTQKT